VDESATDEEDEDDPSIQVRQKTEIERVLPEDKLREEWVMPVKRPKGKRSIRPKSLKRVKWDEEDWERDHGKNPWSSFALAPAREKEMVAKSWVDDARRAARERAQQDRQRHRIGDDVGTGPSSPNAYVEIRERWDGPEQEAVNVVVAEELDIPPETASRLVNLGAVWFYDEFEERDWIRIMKPQKVRYDTVLRVFPNPERYKTCYLDDWDERIKKVDRDFVVVDKPPLLPCHAHVTNGKETLSRAVADGLNVRSVQEVELGMDDTNMTPMTCIDDEVSGLVILARHEKARIVCEEWLNEGKFVFEFVAICTNDVEKGHYRHFYMKKNAKSELPKPTLYDEIPPEAIGRSSDYDDWDIVKMEVVASAKLEGGYAAVRIRTNSTGPYLERIRAQLAMLGAPVLNDKAAQHIRSVDEEVARLAGLLPEPADQRTPASMQLPIVPGQDYSATASAIVSAAPLGGAVDDEVLRGPYGHKLQLLRAAKQAASRGIPQTPAKKVPVALHLARIEFMGRVVTCAPPSYWPEGAAAAVATQLTSRDIKTNIIDYLVSQGGWSTIRKVGGHFGVKADWLEEHFHMSRTAGKVFASESAMKEYESKMRIKRGKKSWTGGLRIRRQKHKEKMRQIREKYVKPQDWNKPSRMPTYKDIKRGIAKPLEDYLGQTHL